MNEPLVSLHGLLPTLSQSCENIKTIKASHTVREPGKQGYKLTASKKSHFSIM